LSHENKLAINVKECKGLPSMDSNGFSDPYVVIKVLDAKDQDATKIKGKRTKTIKKTLNPEFNSLVSLKYNKKADLEGKWLQIEVWDWDLGTSDDFIGKVLVDASGVPQDVKTTSIYAWHALQP